MSIFARWPVSPTCRSGPRLAVRVWWCRRGRQAGELHSHGFLGAGHGAGLARRHSALFMSAVPRRQFYFSASETTNRPEPRPSRAPWRPAHRPRPGRVPPVRNRGLAVRNGPNGPQTKHHQRYFSDIVLDYDATGHSLLFLLFTLYSTRGYTEYSRFSSRFSYLPRACGTHVTQRNRDDTGSCCTRIFVL